MDKKLKLNAKMNIATTKTALWLSVATLVSKLNHAVLRRAMKSQEKEFDILREMLKEDYPEDYKDELREVHKLLEDLA